MWGNLEHLNGPQHFPIETNKGFVRVLENLQNGGALACMDTTVMGHPYVWDGTLREETMVYSLKVLSGILPTRINLSKVRPRTQMLS